MNLNRLIFIIFLLFCISQLIAEIAFYGEEIDFEILDNEFSVKGQYYFLNRAEESINTVIYYPFPADSVMGNIIDFNVVETEQIKLVKDDRNGLMIGLNFSGNDTICCEISYRQRLRKNTALYILTSTRKWRNSLAFAKYKLTVPKSISISSFSYFPESFEIVDKFQYYYWERANFYPDKDFIIRLDK